MARKRMIDPSFWEDPTIGSLSLPARLLFIGMMNHADDEGRIEVEPRYIRRAVFGFDEDITTGLVSCYLAEIRDACRSVQFYEVDGRAIASFTNWKRYQYIQKPQTSRLPAPPTPEQYDTDTVPVSPNRIEENRIEKSGGDTHARQTAAADPNVVKALKECGQSNNQAYQYAVLQSFPPDVLDRLKVWYQEKAKSKHIESAGRLLASFLKNGELPDDLPKPQPRDLWPHKPDGGVDYDELNKIARVQPTILQNRYA